MKVSWKSFVSGALLGSALVSGVSYAAPSVVKMIVNGMEVHSEVPAQIIDGSTMIPARALAELLGARVIWDESSRTVVIEDERYRRLQLKQDDLSEQEAVGVAGDAQAHYWIIASGGVEDRAWQSFDYQGSNYRWMGSDLNTKEKYITYLELLFTPEQAAAYWKKKIDTGGLVEIDGRLAQPNADGGSLMQWRNSTVELLKEGEGTKTFRYTEPDLMEVTDITWRYVKEIGWRIDAPVDTIR